MLMDCWTLHLKPAILGLNFDAIEYSEDKSGGAFVLDWHYYYKYTFYCFGFPPLAQEATKIRERESPWD